MLLWRQVGLTSLSVSPSAVARSRVPLFFGFNPGCAGSSSLSEVDFVTRPRSLTMAHVADSG